MEISDYQLRYHLYIYPRNKAYTTFQIQKTGGYRTISVPRTILAVSWHIQGNPKASFLQKSRQLWGADVNWRTAMAYDATVALIAALNLHPTRSGVQ